MVLLVHTNWEGERCANSSRLGWMDYMQEITLAGACGSICITLVTYGVIIFRHILSLHLPSQAQSYHAG